MILHNLELDILSEVSQIANSTLDLNERLNLITEVTSRKMNTDTCNICLIEDDNKILVLKASTGLRKEAIGKVTLKMGAGITGWVAKQRKMIVLKNALEDSRFIYFPETGEERYKSLLAIPIMDGKNCTGVITVQKREESEYSKTDIELLRAIANQIGGTIRNAQIYQQATGRLEKLSLLHTIGHSLTSTLELVDLFNLIVQYSCEITKASAVLLWIKDKHTYRLKASSIYRDDIDFLRELSVRSKFVTTIMKQDSAFYYIKNANEVNEEESLVKKIFFTDIVSLIAVPLSYRSKSRGILCVVDKLKEDKKQGYTFFSQNDLQMLSTMANHAIVAIDNAYAYERLEHFHQENKLKVKELSFLYEISMAMQSTIKLDKLLHIILGAITSGTGFGFDRAMLLMVNEKTNTIQGMIGLDSTGENDSDSKWNEMLKKKGGVAEWLFSEKEYSNMKSSYNILARSFRIEMDNPKSIITRTVREKRPFNCNRGKCGSHFDNTFFHRLGTDRFAVVPTIAQERVLGVIIVDNLHSSKSITEKDIQVLNRFAIHAGWAIENARLVTSLMQTNKDLVETQDRLIASERLATLGSFSAEIAHEIKNPLVSVGGFARRLYDTVEDNSKAKRYSEIIVKEVERLEVMLKNILQFSSVKTPSLEECFFNDVVRDAIALFGEEIKKKKIFLNPVLDKNIEKVWIDKHQISQVLNNLLVNAIESMPGGGRLDVMTKRSEKISAEGVVLTVKDTGGGVSKEALGSIFNPFFTTKETGTGLGLTLIRKIIDSHGGLLEFENNPGKGIKFIITLPGKST